MQTRDGMHSKMNFNKKACLVVPSLLGLMLLCGGSVAHASQDQSTSPSTGNQNSTANPNGMNNGNMNGKMNNKRRGDGMRNDRMNNGSTGGNMMVKGDMSPNANGVVGDPWGFSDKYMGIDDQTDIRVREVFNENRNRVHMSADPVDIDPAPISYPVAAPGAIDVYHYTDYTHNDIAEGSVSDIRYRKERILMAYHYAEQRRLRELMRNNGMSNQGNMSSNTTSK